MASEKSKSAQTVSPLKGLFVRARPATGFRRCGFFFPPEGIGIAVDALTDEQQAALRAEPNLLVEDCEFPAEGQESR